MNTKTVSVRIVSYRPQRDRLFEDAIATYVEATRGMPCSIDSASAETDQALAVELCKPADVVVVCSHIGKTDPLEHDPKRAGEVAAFELVAADGSSNRIEIDRLVGLVRERGGIKAQNVIMDSCFGFRGGVQHAFALMVTVPVVFAGCTTFLKGADRVVKTLQAAVAAQHRGVDIWDRLEIVDQANRVNPNDRAEEPNRTNWVVDPRFRWGVTVLHPALPQESR